MLPIAIRNAKDHGQRTVTLLVFGLAAFAPALIGAGFPPDAWYESLSKPAWNPPSWLFAPVWTILYLLIGIAGYLAWTSTAAAVRTMAFSLYALQLMLNALWTPLFFGMHSSGLALAVLLALLVVLIGNVAAFHRIKPAAAYLLLPYVAWVAFAALLNAAIYLMN